MLFARRLESFDHFHVLASPASPAYPGYPASQAHLECPGSLGNPDSPASLAFHARVYLCSSHNNLLAQGSVFASLGAFLPLEPLGRLASRWLL